MGNVTTVVNEVQQPQVLCMSKNPRTISSGMKLTEVYKAPSLFEAFKSADVNQDGIISENEFELYDKKETLKKEYEKSTLEKIKFNKNYAISGASFLACCAGALTSGAILGAIFAVGAITAVGFLLYECMKNQKACEDDKKTLDEKIKQLDKEYEAKIATETN